MNLVTKAINYAQSAHAGQVRKVSGSAYVVHPFRVYRKVKSMGVSNQEVLAASILHDTLEDTDVTYQELKVEFGNKVADIVEWLTNKGDKNTHIAMLMAKGPKEAIAIKVADRIDNLTDGASPSFLKKYKGSTDIIKDGLVSRGFKDLLNHFMPVYIEAYGITERTITTFKTKVELDVTISTDATKHLDYDHPERKVGAKAIKDSDIRAAVIKATQKIIQSFMDGEIQEGKKFLIYDPSSDHLNLIATFTMNDHGTPEKITIVTAIRTDSFKANDIKKTIRV